MHRASAGHDPVIAFFASSSSLQTVDQAGSRHSAAMSKRLPPMAQSVDL